VVKIKQLPARQRVRRALLFASLLLFPITLYYLSPYIIVDGAANGVINGSFIAFMLMFFSALFVGRLWCGWVCPAGALQEFGMPINNRPVRGKRLDWVKWLIWVPWIGAIAVLAIRAGGYRALDPLYNLESGITVEQPFWYIIYYIVIVVFLGLSVILGRRAGCHTICWMAPFMILGHKIRNLFRWPSLRLKTDADACIDCERCTRECPMSLDVHGMVRSDSMENSECILCGSCVDICPKGVIHYTFSSGK
jgi:ferredoxin-type protein NapH